MQKCTLRFISWMLIVLMGVGTMPAQAFSLLSENSVHPVNPCKILPTQTVTAINRHNVTINPYRYCGEQYDADLHMYFLRARYMETDCGRFWTMDSFQGRNNDPATLHKYLYTHADPVNGIDPSGEMTLNEMLSASSIAIQSILFTMRHPRIFTAMSFVIGIFVPANVEITLRASGVPIFNPLTGTSTVNRGGIRLIRWMKNKWISKAASRLNPSAGGHISRDLGLKFEALIGEYCKGAKRNVKSYGKYTVDFAWRGWWIEVKSGIINTKQLAAHAKGASKESKNLVYVLLQRPSRAEVKKLAKEGVNTIVLE